MLLILLLLNSMITCFVICENLLIIKLSAFAVNTIVGNLHYHITELRCF